MDVSSVITSKVFIGLVKAASSQISTDITTSPLPKVIG